MVLTPNGEILTNNHVVNGATLITVIIPATQRRYIARVVGTVPASDVAVLSLDGASGLTTVPLGNSDTVSAGAAGGGHRQCRRPWQPERRHRQRDLNEPDHHGH